MPKFTTSLHLPPDIPEDQIDDIGRAVLIEQARKQGSTITGPATRVSDQFVVGVTTPDQDGKMVVTHVPMDSPLAGGRTDPDARSVTWSADSTPRGTDPAPVIEGQVEGQRSSAHLPEAVTEHGGMVAFRHNLGSDAVVVSVFDVIGKSLGYEFAIEISNNEEQVLVPRGAHTIRATIDETEPTE